MALMQSHDHNSASEAALKNTIKVAHNKQNNKILGVFCTPTGAPILARFNSNISVGKLLYQS